MNATTQYEIQHLNLQRLAITKLAIYLWKTPDVKKKLRELLNVVNSLYTGYRPIESFDKLKEWPVLTKSLLKKLKQIDLLPSLKSELALAILGIGVEICAWYTNIRATDDGKQDPINYINKIHWTYYGTIDQVNTINTFLLDNPDLNTKGMYRMVCENMMKENVHDIWNKMSGKIKKKCLQYINSEESPYLLTYWQCFKDQDFSELNKRLQKNIQFNDQLNYSTNEKLMYLTTKEGYYQAMKYFWNKLNKDERDRNVVELASTAIGSFHCYRIFYVKDIQFGHICVFLINQMTIDQKKQFFKDHFLDCLEILSVWPWLEFTMTCMNEYWQYIPSDDDDDHNILDIIVENMYYMNNWGCSMEYNKYRTVFQYVYKKMPTYLRDQNVFIKGDFKWVWRLYELWDLPNLKLLFNTLDNSGRDQLLRAGSRKFESLIKENKWDFLREFKKEVLHKKETKVVKECFKPPDFGIRKNCTVDELLYWMCDTG